MIQTRPATNIDIYYLDADHQINYDVKKKGTFLISVFKAIFTELDKDRSEIRTQLTFAKQQLLNTKLSDLYKIGDGTWPNSEERKWRKQLKA